MASRQPGRSTAASHLIAFWPTQRSPRRGRGGRQPLPPAAAVVSLGRRHRRREPLTGPAWRPPGRDHRHHRNHQPEVVVVAAAAAAAAAARGHGHTAHRTHAVFLRCSTRCSPQCDLACPHSELPRLLAEPARGGVRLRCTHSGDERDPRRGNVRVHGRRIVWSAAVHSGCIVSEEEEEKKEEEEEHGHPW
jgi:hypothetical protein